jgi:hypothetical protein
MPDPRIFFRLDIPNEVAAKPISFTGLHLTKDREKRLSKEVEAVMLYVSATNTGQPI